MQYFYLNITGTESAVTAHTAGIYRDDILLSLLPEGEVSLALVGPSAVVKTIIERKGICRKVSEEMYTATGRGKAVRFAQLFGPGQALSREDTRMFVYAGELPQEPAPQDFKNAHAAVTFEKKRAGIVEVPQRERLYPLIARALVRLLSPHLKKPDRSRLRSEAREILKPVIDGVAAAAAEGITVNNFPGPEPGLCTLWFVTGEELTLPRRSSIAMDPPASLDIGEIALGPDWRAQFTVKSPATPEMFAAYLRVGVESAKATCGCLTFLISALLGLVPAFMLGGRWWLLPAGCAGAGILFAFGCKLVLKLKRKALNRIRLSVPGGAT